MAALALCTCSGEIDAEGFIVQYATAHCDYVYRCCDSSERSYGSKAQCQTRITEQVETLLAFRNEPAAPGARFVPAAGQSCIDQLAGDCPAATRAAAQCLDNVVVAERKDSEDCAHDAQCTSYNCARSGDRGTCAATASPGGVCGGDDRGCPEDHFCAATKRCTLLKDAGEACSAPNECAAGICNPSVKVCSGLTESLCDGQ